MQKLRGRVAKFNGLSVGLDLHKAFIQVSVLEASGEEVLAERIAADADAVSGLLDRLATRGRPLPGVPGVPGLPGVRVALEASGCFVWVYDLLKRRLGADAVKVAAPSKVRAIAQAGEKTDATDAWWLAYLAQEGRLPEAFVAEGDLRELRTACREHRSATDERSDLMRRMRSHLAQLGIGFPKSAWASVAGRATIEALVRDVEAAHGVRGEAVARLWARIQSLSGEVAHWEERVAELSKRFDGVTLLDARLPGVGKVVAAIVWSELGDPRRYRSAKAYAKATGLTPGYRESGGRRRTGTITREGSAHARWAFTRAVLACRRCTKGDGLCVKRWVERMIRRKPRKAAMVAAARKLAEATWRLFTLGEEMDLRRVFPT